MNKKLKHGWVFTLSILAILIIVRFLLVGISRPGALLTLHSMGWRATIIKCNYNNESIESEIDFQTLNHNPGYFNGYKVNGEKEELSEKSIIKNNKVQLNLKNYQAFQKAMNEYCADTNSTLITEFKKTEDIKRKRLSRWGIGKIRDFEVNQTQYSCENKEKVFNSFNEELEKSEVKVFLFDYPSNLSCKKEFDYWPL